MHASEENTSTYQTNKLFLSASYSSKEDFVTEYKKLYHEKPTAEELYITILTELEKAISEGDTDNFKKFCTLIDYINDVEDQTTLGDYFNNTSNPISSTNLVILVCKHNKVKMLEYSLDSDERILNNLSIGIGKPTILPDDEDEEHHNAFYYAIRSGNTDLLDVLIDKWPDNYFKVNLQKLDEILSKAYAKLKLQNVLLPDELKVFIENKLITLRFFSDTSGLDQSFVGDFDNVKERIDLTLQNISFLTTDCSNFEEVDEKFLFVAKSIAQNISTLKRQLKPTYDRLPWEEIEFCLVIFVFSHTNREYMNPFYDATLNKSNIVNHLKIFANVLKDVKDIIKQDVSNVFPDGSRDEVVENIISSSPEFEELYSDYQQVRDIYSLEKIHHWINLALSVDPNEKVGRLVITRALQVIGEHLKNTLESPKLSKTTSELFLKSLPKTARKVMVEISNSLSHASSLSKRIEIEENADLNYYKDIQIDTKTVGDVISEVLHNNKLKIIRVLLEKLADTENLDEIIKYAKKLSVIRWDKRMSDYFEISELKKVKELVNIVNAEITDKTTLEMQLLKQINSIFDSEDKRLKEIKTGYDMGFASLTIISKLLLGNKDDQNFIKEFKFRANQLLKSISSPVKPSGLKEVAPLSIKIGNSIELRMTPEKRGNIIIAIYDVVYRIEIGTSNIINFEKFGEKLKEKGSIVSTNKQENTSDVTEDICNTQLELKLSELKSILSSHLLNEPLSKKISIYKEDKTLYGAVELLVLDIMSILSSSKRYLENYQPVVDVFTPLPIGESLRNYLVHDDLLLDVLLYDSSISVILNAIRLTEDIIPTKIGKSVSDYPFNVTQKYNEELATITNQETMFAAAEKGNLEIFKSCLKKGTDIYGRNINLWTTLHFAAKGSSLEVVKFIIGQNLSVRVKDIDGQNPLHIAAAHGRKNIVEFFINQTDLNVVDENNMSRTALHLAAQNGHKSTVEVLLKHHANPSAQDIAGFSPIFYAISNNHIDVVKILLEKDDGNVDIKKAVSDLTPLHQAAEYGNLEIVKFLLENNADVNAKNDRNCTPLHIAASNGYLDVVKALIKKGADVNYRDINCSTPLFYAVENWHDNIVNILLKHGANVDIGRAIHNITPLHSAAQNGHLGTVQILLKNRANASIANKNGITPLHCAAQNGHLEIVDALLKNGVDIHAKDKTNITPLHFAAHNGHKQVVELLIKNNAKVNSKNSCNTTPLHVAALKGHKDVVNLLMRNNASVTAQDEQGNTPLHLAAVNGSKDIIERLIRTKARVDFKGNNGKTPLHFAAAYGNDRAVNILIENKSKVNATDDNGHTPLHLAVVKGHKDVVNLLIRNKAKLSLVGDADKTPLLTAVEAGHKEIVEILIANGANINAKSKNVMTLLSAAITYNRTEIVQVLIDNGVNLNVEGIINEALSLAIITKCTDIVEILLENNVPINTIARSSPPLQLAAAGGYKKVVKTLLERGAAVDGVSFNDLTALWIAAQEGYVEIVEILIAAGANVNNKNKLGETALHVAAMKGHVNVVKVLLDNEAQVNVKSNANLRPLDFAVGHNHIQVAETLLQHMEVDINTLGNDGQLVLHIAAQQSNLEMVKYLIEKGCDINVPNNIGTKPIHVAAREDRKDILEFFLSKGFSVDERGGKNQTLLHYAAIKGNLEIVNFLIARGADINAKSTDNTTPLHFAASFRFKDVAKVLLQHCAIYDVLAKENLKPIHLTSDAGIIALLESIEKLFEAVKYNKLSGVENCIEAGAVLNAKNSELITPLHNASWMGFEKVVHVLLKRGANPNAVDHEGLTALHYAVQYSHLNVVKALLINHAIYNAVTNNGATPLHFSGDENITTLLKLVDYWFKRIEIGDSQIIQDLNNIADVDTLKAIMRAHNTENKSLIAVAMLNNFAEVKQLKEILQGDISTQIDEGIVLLNRGDTVKADSIFKSALEKRKEILGSNNPGTLDIKTYRNKVLYEQGDYDKALSKFNNIYEKQKKYLGSNCNDTLKTRNMIALTLSKQGKHEEALNIFQEVYDKQMEILGLNHEDVLDTQFHMTIPLLKLKKYEEALRINREIYTKRKELLGPNDPNTVSTQHNIAKVLASRGHYEEALKMYKEVLEKSIAALGNSHYITLRTLQSIAEILSEQKKYPKALEAYEEILDNQMDILGPDNPETLNTQCSIARTLFQQGRMMGALKVYRKISKLMKEVFGPKHPSFVNLLNFVDLIDLIFKSEGSKPWLIYDDLDTHINDAAGAGDIATVEHLLDNGADINRQDGAGRVPLHYAASSGKIDVVKMLLARGADVTRVSFRGNTPLHTATSKGNKEMLEVLFQHVNRAKLKDFVNVKTTNTGRTSLHVAADYGFLDVAKSLLKRGAIYNIKNNEGKIPLQLSKEPNVIKLLKLVEEVFKDAINGDTRIIDKLQSVKPDEFEALTNVRNIQGNTLLQVALTNGHRNIGKKLLEMLKKSDQNL